MELYAERGFDATTVADIAERAGLTERTFFRHFADKREVLFSGGEVLQQAVVDGITAVDPGATSIEAAVRGLETATADFFAPAVRPHSRARQRIIDAHPELQERELIKMARLARAIAEALRERGVAEPSATLTAETAVVIFRVSFDRWVADGDVSTFGALLRESLDGLRSVAAA